MATVAVIGALQLFDQAVIAGGPDGDPNNALMTVVLYLYNAAFSQFNFGYAAAVGVILFMVIFSATLIQRRLFGGSPVVVSDDRAVTGSSPGVADDAAAGRPRDGDARRRTAALAAPRLAYALPDRLRDPDVRPVRLVGHHVVQDPARLGAS